jgi:Tol biopolymer transport system component
MRQVAFTQAFTTTRIQGDLWVVNTDGSNQRQLTRLKANQLAVHPSYSPDGRRIAFQVLTAKGHFFDVKDLFTLSFTSDLFVVDVDGTNVRRLTSDGVSAYPAWGNP